MMGSNLKNLVWLLCLSLAFVGCDRESVSSVDPGSEAKSESREQSDTAQAELTPVATQAVAVNDWLPPMQVPVDNLSSEQKVALGEKLFADPLLSLDQSMSCSTCHDRESGWSNGQSFAEGVNGQPGTRNSLSILNVGLYDKGLFWDGRVLTLEQQALKPIFEKTEMAMDSESTLLERLNSHPDYPALFGAAFDDGVTIANVARALACFERTIVVRETAYDRYVRGDKTAMSKSAIRGLKIFSNPRRANCISCHPAPMFTDQQYYNIGVGMDKKDYDMGRHHVLGWGSFGKFRSPSLRGIDQSAPYMHDGSLPTLEEVVEYYDRGGIRHKYTDTAVQRLRLNDQQKKDLVEFMRQGLAEIKE